MGEAAVEGGADEMLEDFDGPWSPSWLETEPLLFRGGSFIVIDVTGV